MKGGLRGVFRGQDERGRNVQVGRESMLAALCEIGERGSRGSVFREGREGVQETKAARRGRAKGTFGGRSGEVKDAKSTHSHQYAA